MRPGTRTACVVAAVGLVVTALHPTIAGATQMVLQSVDQMTVRADLVVRAVPIPDSSTSRWTKPDGTGLIVTSTRLKVLETLRGDAHPDDEIAIEEFGGTVGDITMTIVGMASFVPDEQVVLFLRRDPDGALRILDLSMGKFEIVAGPRGRETLTRRDLGEVSAAGGAVAVPTTLDALRNAVRGTAPAKGAQP